MTLGGKSRITAIALALFLGGIGGHKFYLRQPVQGILYAVFVWTYVPVLIAIFEMISYLMMTDETFAEKYDRPALLREGDQYR